MCELMSFRFVELVVISGKEDKFSSVPLSGLISNP